MKKNKHAHTHTHIYIQQLSCEKTTRHVNNTHAGETRHQRAEKKGQTKQRMAADETKVCMHTKKKYITCIPTHNEHTYEKTYNLKKIPTCENNNSIQAKQKNEKKKQTPYTKR